MDEATVAHPTRTYKQHKLDATLEKITKENPKEFAREEELNFWNWDRDLLEM